MNINAQSHPNLFKIVTDSANPEFSPPLPMDWNISNWMYMDAYSPRAKSIHNYFSTGSLSADIAENMLAALQREATSASAVHGDVA